MPKYSYRCSSCNKEFDLYHSMFHLLEKCIICEANSVEKMPSLDFTNTSSSDAGKIVNETIEEVRREVEEQKLKLKEGFHD